jgi:S1-C subfamily serine protease
VTVRGREVPVGGDVIVAIDGHAVDSHEELMRYLVLETTPGETVEVELLRDGEPLTEHVTLAERPRPSSRRGGRGNGRVPVR